MPEIPLNKGFVTVVDQIDFERFGHLKWHVNHDGYALRTIYIPPSTWKKIYLHNAIMGVDNPKGLVDHINRQKRDNRRCNLRITTRGANIQNSPRPNSVSGYHGVTWCRSTKCWRVRVKEKVISYHDCPEEAALAYNLKAVETWGPQAYVNKLPPDFVPQKRPQCRNFSGYRGVTFNKKKELWVVRLREKYIGSFKSREMAALAYSLKALDLDLTLEATALAGQAALPLDSSSVHELGVS
jgi:hypothetical protein